MIDLPCGWVEAPVREICQIAPTDPPLSESAPFIPMASVEVGEQYPTSSEPRGKRGGIRAQSGDLLFARITPCLENGKVVLVPDAIQRMGGSTELIVVRPPSGVLARLLYLWSLHPEVREAAQSRMTGTTGRMRLSATDLGEIPFRLPPQREQERIVAAIEEAFSKLDAGEAGLRAVRQLLKRMRGAVLAAAVTGRLVPQNPTDTPATKLLADLGVEPASEPAEDLPATWTTVRLGDLVSEQLANGKSVRSRPGGFPVLRLTCLRDGRIDLAERKDGDWEASDAASVLVHRGDFFVSRGNGSLNLVGRGGLVVDEPDPVAYPDTLIRVRVPGHVLAPALLALVWNAPIVREQLEPRARTTAGIYKVNQSMLVDVRLPLPPRGEQQRIVTEVDRQFSFLDACERAVEVGIVRSAALRRSVLKAAFEGHLAPQDPSDEPASVLLERIRAERVATTKPSRRSRRSA